MAKRNTIRTSGWADSPWRIVTAAVSAAITTVVIGALVVLMVIPKLTGGAALTVLSGSMEPVFMPGDVVVVRGVNKNAVCATISVGDIVTYFPEPNNPDLITHRVIGKTIGTFDDGTSCRLITQGDNNSAVDDPVSPTQVRGTFLYGVPSLGYARQWLGDNPQAVILVAVAALIGWGLWSGFFSRPTTRVIAAPGQPAPTPEPPPTAAPAPSTAALAVDDYQLRVRELDLRERELACREAELALVTTRNRLSTAAPAFNPVATPIPILSRPPAPTWAPVPGPAPTPMEP